jgi:predicted nucleic acid-binding protein
MTILDSTILVDHLRGLDEARTFLRSLDDVPACSEVTRTEIIRGLRGPERAAAEELFSVLAWVSVDGRISRRAGDLGRRYRRSHQGLALADLIIGATALELGEPLATLNVRNFPMFRDLRPPYRAPG